MDAYDVILPILIGFLIGTFIWSMATLARNAGERDSCVDTYEVCVETTDGWKPYID